MPRCEFSEGSSNKFWEVELEGKALTTRYGKIGTEGQTTTKEFASAAAGQKAYEKIVAEKEKKGYQRVSAGDDEGDDEGDSQNDGGSSAVNPALEAAILKAPDDIDGYLVYGDWLQSKGDPRGELIAVQAALLGKPNDQALQKKERDILAEHAEALLGDLMEIDAADQEIILGWRLGFLASVALGGDGESVPGELDADAAYRKIMRLGSSRFIRELKFLALGTEEGEPDYSELIQCVADVGVPPLLRSLTFSCEDYQVSWTTLGDISLLYPKLRKLEELRIKMGALTLGTITLPTLKLFEVITGGLTRKNLASVCSATWPKLETLTLYFGSDSYGSDCTALDLQPIFEAKGLKKLRHLALANAEFTDHLPSALATSSILPQLKTLDLSKGTLSDEGAEVLIEMADAFTHLEKLDLDQNYISDEVAERLTNALPRASLNRQGEGEDADDRYVQVAE